MMEARGYVKVDEITKIFARNDVNSTITALDKVSIAIEPGEFVSIVGASGCGKSTLLRLITGLEQPTRGKVYFDGVEIEGPSEKRGFAFQEPTLFPWLTVRENIAFGLKAQGTYKKKKHIVDELLRLVDLTEFEHSYPHQLSGGMAQRISLVRALACEPDALFLDEPFGALDAFTRMNMQEELYRIWQEKHMTIVMITHDVDEAIYLSNRIIIMSPKPGRVRKIFQVSNTYPRNRNGSDFINIRKEILEILDFAKEETVDYYL